MRFPPSFLDSLRQKLLISEVIGRRVTFDQRKSSPSRGDYWANCPFHGEKTPSFHCEDSKGRYYCFGCGASGDHIKFLVEHENLSFVEAVEQLANEAGMAIPVMDRAEQEREDRRKTLYDVMTLTTQFFQERLQSPEGAKARAYLRDRGLSPAIQEHFAIGYAPNDRSALKEFLSSKNITKDQIERCGLVIFGPDIPVSYDRFRDRIMFPITDVKERVIAFGGRALSPDVPAKYMNSPQTDLFSKSDILYNYTRARRASGSDGSLIIAEGYMDVIALHKAGFENAVAPLGTALTASQINLAWRVGSNPYLCFDGDEAGVRAAHRTIDTCLVGLQAGRSVRFAMMPDGKDPDDLINESGKDGFQSILDQSTPLVDMLWMRETHESTFSTPERRAELEQNFTRILNTITDDSVKRHYHQDMKQRLSDFFGVGSSSSSKPSYVKNGVTDNRGVRSGSPKRSIAVSGSLMKSSLLQANSSLPPLRETSLVMTIANHPSIGLDYFDEFSQLDLTNAMVRNLHSSLLNILSEITSRGDSLDSSQIRTHIVSSGLEAPFDRLQQQLKDNRIWQCLEQA